MEHANPFQGAKPPLPRLAIFEAAGTAKVQLGVVAALEDHVGSWSLQCSGATADDISKMRSVLESYAAARAAAPAGSRVPVPRDFAKLIAAFADRGYSAEEIPAGDYQINFQMDPRTGTMVGTHAATHSLVSSNNPLGRQLFQAIANGLAQESDDLAAAIEDLLERGDSDTIITQLRSAAEKGIFSLPPSERLLAALVRLDVAALAAEDRQFIQEVRIATADQLHRYEAVGGDADALLSEDTGGGDPKRTAALKTTVALGAIQKGNRETGLSMLRDLLKAPFVLDAEGRGWTWRNIARTLETNDPEARRAAQLSADNFLEAGNKQEAGKSLMHLADLLMRVDPHEAIKRLNELIALLETKGLLYRYVRAAALHSRANRFARLNKHADAYRDACESVSLRRGLLGADEAFVSSLYLAAVEAGHLGDDAAATAFEAEAEKVTQELELPHFKLAERVEGLIRAFDSSEAAALLLEAEAQDNMEIVVGVRVLQATLDPSITDEARLEILEDTRKRVLAARAPDGMMKPIQLAIGQLLARKGYPERAEKWLREILDADAFDGPAQQMLVDCLWKQEKWGDASIFLRKQLALRGNLPGLTFALGKSQIEAGDMSGAVTTLTKLINAIGEDNALRPTAIDVRERALRLGGTILPERPPAQTAAPVTRDEFEKALTDFARFVAAEKRMRFWVSGEDGGHKWVANPEARAQDILHTFLKARMGERVEIFEEVSTGAGRLDLYVKLEGGLAIILELKMCGSPYSSAYAASGEGQIRHYMDNRITHLGYLVVFDARVNLFGQRLIGHPGGQQTIVELIVDVRSRVKPC
jgi:tetratricopeptide (TPR) repeat protein